MVLNCFKCRVSENSSVFTLITHRADRHCLGLGEHSTEITVSDVSYKARFLYVGDKKCYPIRHETASCNANTFSFPKSCSHIFFQETLKISSCKLFSQATRNVLHVVTSKILVKISAVYHQQSHDMIRITIQRPRYDTYHDTGLHWISPQNFFVKQLFIKHCIL